MAFEHAQALLARGQYTEALDFLNSALAGLPSIPALYNLRGLAEVRLGLTGQAEADFRKAMALSPTQPSAYTNLGALLTQTGRPDEAIPLFQEALKLRPDDLAALIGAGLSEEEVGKYSGALSYLSQASKALPADAATGLAYARDLMELKRPDEAGRVLASLPAPAAPKMAAKYDEAEGEIAADQGQWAKAADCYSRAYHEDPNSFSAYLGLVRIMLRGHAAGTQLKIPEPPSSLSPQQTFTLGLELASAGAYSQAIPYFERTLADEPSSYAAAFNLALSYKRSGQQSAAVALCHRTLQSHPTAELYDLLASLEEKNGDFVKAVRHYQRALALAPGEERYYFDVGAEYLAHFTFAPAVEAFQSGSKRFPNIERERLGLGFALYAERHYRQAAQAFLQTLEIDPKSPSAFKAWNSLPTFLNMEEWQNQVTAFKTLASRHPHNADALCCYGVALFRYAMASGDRSRLSESRQVLVRALELKPDFAEAHLALGRVEAEGKDYTGAAKELKQAVELDPGSLTAHYQLGQVYRQLNQMDLADSELRTYSLLSENRRAEMGKLRSQIKQFVLSQPAN